MIQRKMYGVLLMLLALVFPATRAATVAVAGAPSFSLERVGPGVWAAFATPKGKAGSNAGFVVGSDSVAVIDTFEDAGAARELLAAIRKITNLPVRYVVNTHYHIDHVAGNNVFAAAGATILAQENVRFWERTENLKFFGAEITPEQKSEVESLGLPRITYKHGVDIYLGSRRLEVRSLPGHTGGDSIIAVPNARVVFCGDLFWKQSLPNLIDASTGPWVETLDKILADFPAAIFVPGHGNGVGHAAGVQYFRDYLIALRAAVAKAQAEGKSGSALVDAALPGLREKYGSWNFFNFFVAKNIEQTAEELLGRKRLPPRPPGE